MQRKLEHLGGTVEDSKAVVLVSLVFECDLKASKASVSLCWGLGEEQC
jgi:hypothetical protein